MMDFVFLNAVGTVLFVRSDMEQGNWTQEEYSVNATFPYDPEKVILRGMRISFRDPAIGTQEIFEIRNVTNFEPEHYQQIIAEHIAVSELTDDHISNSEITNKTAAQAITTVLTGTLWSLGNSTASGTSSVNITRGSVWQAVNAIQANWNVYITPRITVNTAGSITGRYLDITPAQGIWRGLRLTIDKNMSDASVCYDDTNVITAMYGYGGMIEVQQQTQQNTRVELTFKDVVWSETADHPAKPSGQTYINYPEKTAAYGRNGRPRFGYYQNGDIKDANVLLQKTWEMLKATSDPRVSIRGTVADLYRLGYTDVPLRLHDTAIIEISGTDIKLEKTVIKLDVDLVDPTATLPEIGDYIPNIVYINRDTEKQSSGGGGSGGGGGRGQSNADKKIYDTFYDLNAGTNELGSWISMVVGKRNGNTFIKSGEIALAINSSSGESSAFINADHVNISATQDAYMLAGDVFHDADGKLVIKSAAGLFVQRDNVKLGVFDNGNLTSGVIASKVNGGTTEILGSKIKIGNSDAESELEIRAKISQLNALRADVEELYVSKAEIGDLIVDRLTGKSISVVGLTATTIMAQSGGIRLGTGGTLNGNCVKGIKANSSAPSGQIGITVTPAEGAAYNVNFNLADIQWVKDQMSAKYNEGYSAGQTAGYSSGYSTGRTVEHNELAGYSSFSYSGSGTASVALHAYLPRATSAGGGMKMHNYTATASVSATDVMYVPPSTWRSGITTYFGYDDSMVLGGRTWYTGVTSHYRAAHTMGEATWYKGLSATITVSAENDKGGQGNKNDRVE